MQTWLADGISLTVWLLVDISALHLESWEEECLEGKSLRVWWCTLRGNIRLNLTLPTHSVPLSFPFIFRCAAIRDNISPVWQVVSISLMELRRAENEACRTKDLGTGSFAAGTARRHPEAMQPQV